MADLLDEATVGAVLGTRWLGRAWRHVGECGSTNDLAAAWARQGAPQGAVVVAEAQSAGRGRLGRSWYSPPGENLYFSVVLRPPIEPRLAPAVTLVAAVALAKTVSSFGLTPELKWPNDLLLDGRKVAGILAELALAGERIDFLVLGIGVDLNAARFPAELEAIATSLARALGAPVDRARFTAALCGRLEENYERWIAEGASPLIAEWKRFARLVGRHVTVDSGDRRLNGTVLDLDELGALELRGDDGRHYRILSGELVRVER